MSDRGYVEIWFEGYPGIEDIVSAGFSTLLCDSSTDFVKLIGLDEGTFVRGRQVHGDRVVLVGEGDSGSTVPAADGLVTSQRRLALTATFADCVPLFMVEPSAGLIALVHAGWRGTVKRIAEKAVQVIVDNGGLRERILVALGPHICKRCYEVDEMVLRQFSCSYSRADEFFEASRPGHWLLDLDRANRRCLEEAGVLTDHISSCGLCTSCSVGLLSSRRRDGERAPLMRGAIFLK